ncbi:MAG: TetR/AcrR family transcriptional regulator, partial [Marmoricola sp.]
MTAEPISIESARRDMYRRQILNAAEVEFSRTGFASTKMSAIAKTADLSLATLYKNFAGKSEIWDSLHAERMADLLARVSAESDRSATALDRILG